jgi:CubicO group peptidase (beta-lactamase class C family)
MGVFDKRWSLVASILFCVWSAGAFSAPRPCERPVAPEPQAEQPFPQEVQRALEALVRAELERVPHAGLSVGVFLGPQRWAAGYGLRDLERKLPATPRTTYRMASVTKSFTAVAVMQLVQEGRIHLDADIRTLVPAYLEKPWPVTVRQLLGHLGGVPHYSGPEDGANVRKLDTAGALALFADRPLAAEPGTKFIYTSHGYNLLGAAVEAASGQPYGDYMAEHVFGPAGMSHAAMDDHRTRDEHHAAGYRLENGRPVPSTFLDVSSRFAGGGTRASVEDMLAFARAVMDHRLVWPDTTRQMHTPMRLRDGRLADYGMGFGTYPQRGHYVVNHMGGQPETTTLLFLLPAEGLAVALATNLEGQDPLLKRLSLRIVELLREDGVVRRDAYATEPVDAVLYEGLFRLFSYGVAYQQWTQAGRGLPLAGGDVTDAFGRVEALLDRTVIAQDPQAALGRLRAAHEPRLDSILTRVAVHMARTLEEARGPEALRAYPARGPLAFVSDYLDVCEARACPEPFRFHEPLRVEVRRLDTAWRGAQVKALQRQRLDEAVNPEKLWPALQATASAALHPDYSEEMLRLATRLERPAQRLQRLRWVERTVALHPRSVPARLTLAETQLALGRQAQALRVLQELAASPEGAKVLTPPALLERAGRASAPPVARGLLRAAVVLHPQAPELWRELSRLEKALGNTAAARKALTRAEQLTAKATSPAP